MKSKQKSLTKEQNVDILLPIEKFGQNALKPTGLFYPEENVPQSVQLYDAFVRYENR